MGCFRNAAGSSFYISTVSINDEVCSEPCTLMSGGSGLMRWGFCPTFLCFIMWQDAAGNV